MLPQNQYMAHKNYIAVIPIYRSQDEVLQILHLFQCFSSRNVNIYIFVI